jgi:hypothetical protein
MRRLLNGVLAALGLVSARRHQALQQQLAELKAGAVAWKAKANEAGERAKSLEQEVRRQSQLAEKAKAAADKAARKQVEFDALVARLQHAERELAGAREHLMLIEVKLDILEGAANVLDARTRTAVPRSAGETGAAV